MPTAVSAFAVLAPIHINNVSGDIIAMKRLISKYRRSLIWNASLVLFSLLAYLTTHLYKISNFWYNLLPLYPLIIAFFIILSQTLWQLYLKLITRIQLVDYIKSSHFCITILNDQGDVSTRTHTKLNNISSKGIEWLPEESVRFSVDPGKSMPFKIKSITPGKTLKIAYLHQFDEHISGKKLFCTTWRPKVEPAVEKSQEFEYEWLIDRIEKAQTDAFQGQDEFHVRITQYYDEFSAEIIAPSGYKFSFIESFVTDLNGNKLEGETKQMSQPVLNKTVNIMTIEQRRPRPLTVYKYKHSLERL